MSTPGFSVGVKSRLPSQANDIRHGTYYLRCNKHARKSRTGEPCHPNNLKEEKVIQEIGEFLQLFSSTEMIEATLAELAPGRDIEKEIAAIEKKRQRLAFALADGKMDATIYRVTDDLFLDQLDRAQAQMQELAIQLEAQPDLSEIQAALEDLVTTFPQLVAEAEPAEISAALQRSRIKALVEEREVIAVLIQPTGSFCLGFIIPHYRRGGNSQRL